MSRFLTINPFNPADAGDAETVYYNGQLMCKDTTQPLAKYIDAQDIPILKDVGKFSVLLTQLELNNITPQLPVYEVEMDNFTETIAWMDNTLSGGSVNTVFPGYTYTNAWYARPHKLVPLTNFSLTFFNGSSAPQQLMDTSILIGTTLKYFSVPLTPPTPNFGTITNTTSSNTGNIHYFNISDDGLHIIILADNLSSVPGDQFNFTVYGNTYTTLSLTNVTPLYDGALSTQYVYTFDFGVERTPIIPKAELAMGSYTALNALKLRFFLQAEIYKVQPTYQLNYSFPNINELPQTQLFTRMPLVDLDAIFSSRFPKTKAVFYQMSDLLNSVNGGFQGFMTLLNGELALQYLLTNGFLPTTLPYVSTTAPFIKYDYATSQLKLYLDPYGFQNLSGSGGFAVSGGTATPTSLTNTVPQSTDIYETETFLTFMNADFKTLLSGFASFTIPVPAYPENILLVPADYTVEPFQSSITSFPLLLDTQVEYKIPVAMLGDPTTFPDFITQGTTVCLLTVHMSIDVANRFNIGEIYYIKYLAGIFTNNANSKNVEDLNGYYKLQSVNIDSNSLTFELNAQFWAQLPFVGTSYYQADSGFSMSGNVYKPVTYTYPFNISRSADPAPVVQGRYKECVNMVLKSDINKFNLTMSSVDALVITTTNIPIQKEYNTKTMLVETNNLGNNTNKGTFLNILYTLNLPNGTKDAVITLPVIPEHKKNYMMTLNTELKVIDLQFWWKNRLTNELTPLTMPQNSSILFKLRFKKELK